MNEAASSVTEEGPERAASDHARNWYRAKVGVLGLVLIAHLLIAFFVTPSSRINGDEGVYHMMAEAFTQDGSLTIWNGLDEVPGPALVPMATRAIDGRLVAQYPHLGVILIAPLYLAFGFKAFYLVNAVAFIGIAGLIFLLASRLFGDRNLALNACLIFLFCTFSWQYAHSAWPQSITQLLILASFWFCVLAGREHRLFRVNSSALLTGFLLGLAVGFRLDSIFIAPAIATLVIIAEGHRLRIAAFIGVGLLPCLLALAWINHLKFGSFMPFSYGAGTGGATSLSTYGAVAGFGIVGLLGIWAILHPKIQALAAGNPKLLALGLAVAVFAVALVPDLRAPVLKLGDGFHTIVVDSRSMPLETSGGRKYFKRGPTGGIFTPLRGVKKALLQSSPYLVLLLLPAAALFARRRDRPNLLALFVAFGSFVFVFSYLKWHGGSSLNMRYLLPSLPFAALLVAYAWRDVTQTFDEKTHFRLLIFGAVSFIGTTLLVSKTYGAEQSLIELILLAVPVALVVVLLVFAIAFLLPKVPLKAFFTRGLAAFALLAFIWGAVTTFFYDYPKTLAIRNHSDKIGRLAEQFITPDSLVVLPSFFPFSAYSGGYRTRFLAPLWDDFASFTEVADFNLAQGRTVYVWADPIFQTKAEELDLLESYSTEKLGAAANVELWLLRRAD